MKNLSKAAKAIMGFVALAASTGLGFLPHSDPWFNILTGVVAVLGVYGIYAVPNKVLASDVLNILGKFLPPAVVAQIAPMIGGLAATVDPAAVPPLLPVSPVAGTVVVNNAGPAATPIPAVIPPVPADVTITPDSPK